MTGYLEKLEDKSKLRQMNKRELNGLCQDIREYLIETVSVTGGHLASNLGVVELSVALHTIFDTPTDQIVFDVGHQCYTHKILTGRKDQMYTLRQENGISGFPKPQESEHDSFIAGHSSVAISIALGMAKAKKIKREEGHVIALLGDGAFSGGPAYEGLNNACENINNFIVILNDNEMSISKNVGAMANYLSKIRATAGYMRAKDTVGKVVKSAPVIGGSIFNALKRTKQTLKHIVYKNTFFEDLGFHYLGPVDGHNMHQLLTVLKRAKEITGPVFLHVLTQKGKGYNYAEQNPGAYHGISKFNVETGNPDSVSEDSFSTVFGKKLVSLGEYDESICAITAAMKYPTGLQYFKKKFLKRFFDVGIAEQHAVSFSAGLSKNGLKPVFAVYSTFLQRTFDQLVHDISIMNLPFLLAIDRAGIVGDDGETHQGIFDVSMLRSIPNFTIYTPSNYSELEYWLEHALDKLQGPTAIRYPRGAQEDNLADYEVTQNAFDFIEEKKAKVLLMTYGRTFSEVLKAKEILQQHKVFADIIKLNRVQPLDKEVIAAIDRKQYSDVYFFEEGVTNGGVGEYVGTLLAGKPLHYHLKAIDNPIVKQAKVPAALDKLGLSAKAMAQFVLVENQVKQKRG